MNWLIWIGGLLVLLAAGFGTAWWSRRHLPRLRRRSGWSAARAAIELAGISRDAGTGTVPEAELLLVRAELLAAGNGGIAAARSSRRQAVQADQLWRAAARESSGGAGHNPADGADPDAGSRRG